MSAQATSSSKDTNRFLSEIGKSDEALIEMMMTLVKALEERDIHTKGHSDRVSILAGRIAREMGLDDQTVTRVERGALLHDIGKIGIPDAILFKPGKFSQEERAKMDQHPEKGHFILLNCHRLYDLIPIVRNHHENFDGTGYPDNLKDDEIPLEVKIVSLSDYFDALATARPYKQPYPKEQCIAYVETNIKKKFDPDVAKTFLGLVDNYYKEHVEPIL